MNEIADLLLFEMWGRGPADIKAAIQMHFQHRVPFVHAHLVKEAVAQNARVVHHHVDAAKVVHRGLHNARGALRVRHAVGVGHRLTAQGLDLVHHFLRRARVMAFARHRRTDVVDHQLGPFARHGQGNIAPNAAAGPGDHHHFAVDQTCCTHVLSLLSGLAPNRACSSSCN